MSKLFSVDENIFNGWEPLGAFVRLVKNRKWDIFLDDHVQKKRKRAERMYVADLIFVYRLKKLTSIGWPAQLYFRSALPFSQFSIDSSFETDLFIKFKFVMSHKREKKLVISILV